MGWNFGKIAPSDKIMLPKQFEKYFWDTDFKKVDKEKHKAYIIAKVLEHGNLEAVRWLFRNYQKRSLITILTKSRQFTPKVANFWATYFDIPKTKVLCLNKSFREMQKSHWIH